MWYRIVQLDEREGPVKFKLSSLHRFKNKRANARKPNVPFRSFDNYFDATKFVSRQTLRDNVVELAEGYPKMKTI